MSDKNIKTHSWLELLSDEHIDEILQAAMANVAQNLSIMTNREIIVEKPTLRTIPLGELMEFGTNSPEAETVGVYLLIEGDVQGQTLLIFGLEDAFYLIDMMMGEPVGTTTEMDELAQSAMAEIGNLSLASFLNVLSDKTGHSILPSPPAVIIDMAASILTAVAANSMAFATDELIIFDSMFKDADRIIQADFWVLPNPDANILEFVQSDE